MLIETIKNKKWLYNQYMILVKSANQIAQEQNTYDGKIRYWLKKFNIPIRTIKESTFESHKKGQKTNLIKYGVDNYFKLKDKIRESYIKKFKVNNPSKLNWVKKKKEKTCLKKFGIENQTQSPEIKEKIKKTCLKKYRAYPPSRSEAVKNNIKNACLNKYGVESYMKTPDFIKLKNSKENILKCKKTWKNKSKKEMEIIVDKAHQTRKKNKSYGKSIMEDKFHKWLIENLDPNIERQKKYSNFAIDFYSPLLDLYIQFDGDYWHGLTKFNKNTSQGKIILKTMKKDKIQNKLISNLIRVKESEFKKYINNYGIK